MKYLKLIILSIALITFSNCNQDFQRPKTVPEKANWVGGSDGGVWIESYIRSDSSAVLKIYSHNGDILKNSEFILNKECRDVELSEEVLNSKMSAFDGSSLLLSISRNDRLCTLVLVP
ncbi:MAG: hypothetical protein RIC57_12100 [Balneola sp.]